MTDRVTDPKPTMSDTQLREPPRDVRHSIPQQLFQGFAQLDLKTGQGGTVHTRRHSAARVHQLAPASTMPEQLQSTLGVVILANLLEQRNSFCSPFRVMSFTKSRTAERSPKQFEAPI